jgi:hypothetical protein
MQSIQTCRSDMPLESSQPTCSRPSSSSYHISQSQSCSSGLSHFIILDPSDWKRRSTASGLYPCVGFAK